MMKSFIYHKNEIPFLPSKDAITAYVGSCNSWDDLMDQLSSALHFPTCFGRNLDALRDCIDSLYEVPQKYVTIVHTGFLNIPEDKFEQYVSIMSEAVNIWALDILHEFPFVGGEYGPEHHLDVVFPEDMRTRIESILKMKTPAILASIEDYRKNLERHKLQDGKSSTNS